VLTKLHRVWATGQIETHRRNKGVNLYGFVGNDSINNEDALGLMILQALKDIAQQEDQIVSQSKCCCSQQTSASISITGTHSGTTVTGTETFNQQGCVYSHTIYWWDCYSGKQEAGVLNQLFGGVDFHNYGYSAGGTSYPKTASPGWWATHLHVGDPYHIAMDALAIYIYCDGGHLHAKLIASSNELEWTWDKPTQAWTGP